MKELLKQRLARWGVAESFALLGWLSILFLIIIIFCS